MFPRLLRKLKLKTSVRNKIAILFIFCCCITSVFYLISKIQATSNEYKRRSIYKNENNHDMYLISTFLYIYDKSHHNNKRQDYNILNLIFLSKKKEQGDDYICISKDNNGEIFKSKLNLSLIDFLTKETFLHQGKCQILPNYISFFIETKKRTIEIEPITEIIHVPMNPESRSVCILPLFLYSNIENLKNVIEYYKTNLYNYVNIYEISLKKDVNRIIDNKVNFVKNIPWFIFNRKENINSIRNFHTISFTKNNIIESMKSAIYDCYYRYKDLSKEIVFLNLNNYLPNGTNFSHINELFVSPLMLLFNDQNVTKNDNQKILKNVHLNFIQSNNNSNLVDNHENIIQTGECFCNGDCNNTCEEFNQEKILKFNIKNDYKKEKTGDGKKIVTMNDFDLVDTEYFEIMLSNKCSFLFQEERLVVENNFEGSNRVKETFNNVLQYFKGTKPVNEEKRCYVSLLFNNITCTVSNLSFNNLINMTNIHLPYNNSFVIYEDGCHF